jgi:peptidoglycan/LPS O-acetylase OafA/YrhL
MKDSSTARFPVIDAFKAIASQFIVLHHLAAYGPISTAVQQTSPAMIDWLYDYARMAVQVFFVIGGYLAARSMFSSTASMPRLTTNLINRYLRLVVPFFFALILAIICAFVSRQLLADNFIPAAPELLQILSHVFLLHGVLDFDSLSAGAWFIAVDFQLFAVMLGIASLGGRAIDSRKIVLVMVTLLAAASLFWFNRHASYDDWALYFFGAYGMGAMAYWAGQREQQAAWLWLNVAIALTALFLDFRLRILIAVSVALILFFTRKMQIKEGFKLQKITHYLGTISYALFLVHFSVVMLANAVFGWFKLSDSLTGFVFMVFSWLASLILADIFYRRIEKPAITVIKLSVNCR